MTRDSHFLKLLSISAIVLAIIAAADPVSLGLKPVALNWIKLLSTIVGTLSGWASTSWLPGKNDDQTVKGSGGGGFVGMLLVCALAGSTLIGCAGSLRVQLIKAHQGIETSLATIDDAERVVCFGTTHVDLAPDPTKCNNPLAVTAKLTDAKHQEFHRLLSKAYDAQARLGPVLQSWKGPGLPADLMDVLTLSDEITALAREFNPSVPNIGELIKTALVWQSELASIKAALSRGVK